MGQGAEEVTSHSVVVSHPFTLDSMANLALTWKNMGRYRDAMSLLQTCSTVWQRVLGPDHPYIVFTLQALMAKRERDCRGDRLELPHDRAKATPRSVFTWRQLRINPANVLCFFSKANRKVNGFERLRFQAECHYQIDPNSHSRGLPASRARARVIGPASRPLSCNRQHKHSTVDLAGTGWKDRLACSAS